MGFSLSPGRSGPRAGVLGGAALARSELGPPLGVPPSTGPSGTGSNRLAAAAGAWGSGARSVGSTSGSLLARGVTLQRHYDGRAWPGEALSRRLAQVDGRRQGGALGPDEDEAHHGRPAWRSSGTAWTGSGELSPVPRFRLGTPGFSSLSEREILSGTDGTIKLVGGNCRGFARGALGGPHS